MALKKLVTNSLSDDAVTITKIDNNLIGGITPVGGIIMWSGSIASIPSGWNLCDGSNGTPDLQDKFVVGAGSGYAVNAEGGSADAVVVSHNHSITDTGHKHNLNYQQKLVEDTGSAHVTDISRSGGDNDGGSTDYLNEANSGFMEDASTGISIDTEGVSGTNKNLPPYMALAYIMRVS